MAHKRHESDRKQTDFIEASKAQTRVERKQKREKKGVSEKEKLQ